MVHFSLQLNRINCLEICIVEKQQIMLNALILMHLSKFK